MNDKSETRTICYKIEVICNQAQGAIKVYEQLIVSYQWFASKRIEERESITDTFWLVMLSCGYLLNVQNISPSLLVWIYRCVLLTLMLPILIDFIAESRRPKAINLSAL